MPLTVIIRRAMQMALLHRCFESNYDPGYDYYVRVRPDSYFSAPIPSLLSMQPASVTTWLKHDAPGSDQFFIFERELYFTWWLRVIKPRVLKGTFSSFPEFDIFPPSVSVSQRSDIFGCLLRDSHRLQCWRTLDATCDDSMQRKLERFPQSSCNIFPKFDEFFRLQLPAGSVDGRKDQGLSTSAIGSRHFHHNRL